jgi:predicted small secreted protein
MGDLRSSRAQRYVSRRVAANRVSSCRRFGVPRGEGNNDAMKRKALIAAAFVLAAACATASGSGEDGPIEASGIQLIVIRSGPLDVRVSGGEQFEMSFDSDSATRIVHRRDGSRLRVWIRNDGLLSSAPPGQIRISVPRGIDLIVETGSGRIIVDSADERKCSVHTISGGIQLHDVRGRLSVESVSGSIVIDSTEGGVIARSVSGGITGRRLKLTEDSSFSSISGDIEIGLDSALETLAFDLKSISGSVRIGSIRAERGLRMGFGATLVKGSTISGALFFQ